MAEAIRDVEAMIARTHASQDAHRQAGRMIDAAACAIRLRALADVLDRLRRGDG